MSSSPEQVASVDPESPDESADSLIRNAADPFKGDRLRYDYHTADPSEAAGVIASLIPRGARVLDVGCGTGSMSRILVDYRGVDLVGVEPDVERAAAAHSRGIHVLTGTFDSTTVATLGTFDVVLFADVLEHLVQPAAPLRLARHVLRPGGVVIASVPNIAHWSVRLRLLAGRFDYESYGIMDATHLRWFTADSLRALFDACGYCVDTMRHTAGTGLMVYRTATPWRYVPVPSRHWIVRKLARTAPRLFGCQHVVRAVPQAEKGIQ